jgi:hypothetical protein
MTTGISDRSLLRSRTDIVGRMSESGPPTGDIASRGLALSILTPSFGYGRFIGQAIDSCRSQGVDSYEHIIQDACSTDETAAVVASMGDAHLRFFQMPDSGQSDALNMALDRARGEWVGWLNADEYYLPGAFAHVLSAIERNPTADIVFGDCLFVDVEGRPIRLLPSHPYSDFVLENYGCFIQSCATFVRRSALAEVGWDVGFRRAMDWDLWLSLRGRNFHHLPQTLAAFRIHPDQVTAVPESAEPAEFVALRQKHDIARTPLMKRAGLLAHGGLKLLSGGYARQLRVAREVSRSGQKGVSSRRAERPS